MCTFKNLEKIFEKQSATLKKKLKNYARLQYCYNNRILSLII